MQPIRNFLDSTPVLFYPSVTATATGCRIRTTEGVVLWKSSKNNTGVRKNRNRGTKTGRMKNIITQFRHLTRSSRHAPSGFRGDFDRATGRLERGERSYGGYPLSPVCGNRASARVGSNTGVGRCSGTSQRLP